ncbi:MAG: hypothetical protein LBR88_04415 [Zoogloeaceae bacterium]|jgi:hypothetical protein|nr:hypothetical protein [Zoogloeaceae bacterium]
MMISFAMKVFPAQGQNRAAGQCGKPAMIAFAGKFGERLRKFGRKQEMSNSTEDLSLISCSTGAHSAPIRVSFLSLYLFAMRLPVEHGYNSFQQKLATALQGCRSNSIGKGFLSPPQWLRSKPRPSGRGSNLRTALKGGVSNRS